MPSVHGLTNVSALMVAAASAPLGAVQDLLATTSPVDLDAASPEGLTALSFAVLQGRLEVVQALLAAGASPNANPRSVDGRLYSTPLEQAVALGDVAITKALLEYGADPAAVCLASCLDEGNAPMTTPLHTAVNLRCLPALVHGGHVTDKARAPSTESPADLLRLLLASGADPNAANGDGDTVLLRAVAVQNVAAVDLLVAHAASGRVNALNGNTVLHIAAQAGHSRRSRLLATVLQLGHVNVRNHVRAASIQWRSSSPQAGETPLLFALKTASHEQDLFETVSSLLAAGANVNAADTNGGTPFIVACQRGYAAVLYVLAQAHADVNHRDKAGLTGLHHACRLEMTSSVEVLVILFSVDVNRATPTGTTPFMLACATGNKHLVRTFLTKRKIDLGHCDDAGRTALHLASAHGHAVVINELLSYPGLPVDAIDKEGRSPYLLACASGHVAVAKALAAVPRVDTARLDKTCKSALMLACENGRLDVVQWLLESPAELASLAHEVSDGARNATHRRLQTGYATFEAACTAGHRDVAALLFQVPLVAIEASLRALRHH
uniref:Secreted protein n=1 Tax=Achlya hypogyna TaxID=1202772 RepID=A0A0A7CP56_ACHHY|nr:secreted protein [Achlya hypogyna]